MTLDKTQVRKDLDDAVDRLGWQQALAHLAAKARAEGQKELGGTLAVLADVLNDDLAAIDELLEDSYEQE